MMGNVVSYLWDGIASKADGEDTLLSGMFPMRTRWQHEYVKKRALEEDGYKIKDIPVVNGLPPKEENKIRFVVMSDTHDMQYKFDFPIPEGDVFIHGGDFSGVGRVKEVKAFNDWLGRLPHPHKIVIAGNHEVTFDPRMNDSERSKRALRAERDGTPEDLRELLTNCTYLEDSSVSMYGYKIYGSPWTPTYGNNWGFNLDRGEEIKRKWEYIPSDTALLLTHGPPLGCLDMCLNQDRGGCEDLLETVVERVRPMYHIFGHIHEGYGMCSNGETIFVNASTCSYRQRNSFNKPIVFDLPKKEGGSS